MTAKDESQFLKFIENEIYLPIISCLSVNIFKEINNQEILTILSDWESNEAYQKFLKSPVYKLFTSEIHISQLEESEILKLHDKIRYQNELSDLYCVSKIYVKDFEKFIETTRRYYSDDRLKTSEILRVKTYTRLGNNQIIIRLYNWRTIDGIRNFRTSEIRKNEPVFPEFGVDTYPMSELVLTLTR